MTSTLKGARPYVVLFILSLIVYTPVMSRASNLQTDFGIHIRWAINLPETTDHVVHVLFHSVFLVTHRVLPAFTLTQAALAAILLFMLPLPLIVFAFFKKAAEATLPDPLLMALSLGLTIMSPITIWTNVFMLGYMNPIVYHNPTSIALRLFVIPVSLLALQVFHSPGYRSGNRRVYILLLCAVTILLATLAKPSLTIALIPGCCLYAIWRLSKRMQVDWLQLIFGVCVPGTLMLGMLYMLTYVNGTDDSSVAFGFLTYLQRRFATWQLPIMLFLSLVFPISVYIGYRKQARQNLYLNMSWVIFVVAAGMAYFLYEIGARIDHGNFVWPGYSAVFLLLFASMLFLLEQHAREHKEGLGNVRIFGITYSQNMVFLMLIFGLHVLSGIAYYSRFLTYALG